MYSLAQIIIGILIVAFAFLIVDFRFLLYPLFPSLNPMRNAKRISLDGPSLFISDLHLRADRPFTYSQSLRQFLEARHVSNLIIVGDLFDSPQDAQKIMAKGAAHPINNFLGFDELRIKVFFVFGSPPHDPTPRDRAIFTGTSIIPLGKCAILDFKQLRVVVYHGHDMSWKGAIAHSWDRFISKLSLERAWKRRSGVADSDWVIFGHTHIPGIDAKHRVANCGGWQSKGFLVRPACTGIFLSPENDSLEIVNFAERGGAS
jgi:UDP-2,3-diacylglucosamine pyrophosphatase LpxH